MTYAMLTDYQSIETAVAKLTKKGQPVMLQIGSGGCSFFDNGIVPNSGIWGEQLAQECGVLSGVLTGLRKQGLLEIFNNSDDEGTWVDLTPLGADVANFLAGNLTLQADAEAQMADEELNVSTESQVPTAEPVVKVTKTEAYAMIKSMRASLSAADEAVYRGTQAELVSLLEHVASQAQYLRDMALSVGVTCGKA